VTVQLRKPARELLTAMLAGSTLTSSDEKQRWASIIHYDPSKVRGVKYDLVEALLANGYVNKTELPGRSTRRYNYFLTVAGRAAAAEAINAPQEST
jgi:hypothetical protein